MKDITHIILISIAMLLMIVDGYLFVDVPDFEDFRRYLFCWLLTVALMIWQVVF